MNTRHSEQDILNSNIENLIQEKRRKTPVLDNNNIKTKASVLCTIPEAIGLNFLCG